MSPLRNHYEEFPMTTDAPTLQSLVLRPELNKSELQAVSLEEQTLFLTIAHITNEMNALLRAAVWSADFSPRFMQKQMAK